MASLTMMTGLMSGAGAAAQRASSIGHRQRSLIVAKASAGPPCQEVTSCSPSDDGKENSGRRAAILAAAAAAVICVAAAGTGDKMVAMAREEPKRGTPDARKLYAPVCVTMPTARICHKIA